VDAAFLQTSIKIFIEIKRLFRITPQNLFLYQSNFIDFNAQLIPRDKKKA
jgi:hypothetical protein